jgi:hypothetical protein
LLFLVNPDLFIQSCGHGLQLIRRGIVLLRVVEGSSTCFNWLRPDVRHASIQVSSIFFLVVKPVADAPDTDGRQSGVLPGLLRP